MTGFDDQDFDKALGKWANDCPDDAGFLAQLVAIPGQHAQVRLPVLVRALQAIGGWGFATPQLAGLVVAAWLGVSSGSAAIESDDALIGDAMSAHIFGIEEIFEG